MLLGIAENRRKKYKTWTACVQLSLEVQNGLTCGDAQMPDGHLIGLHGPDPLLTACNLYLVSLPQNIKQRPVLKRAAAKTLQVDVRQIIQIVKHRLVVHKPKTLQENATASPELNRQRKNKLVGPGNHPGFGQDVCAQMMLRQRRSGSGNRQDTDPVRRTMHNASLPLVLPDHVVMQQRIKRMPHSGPGNAILGA